MKLQESNAEFFAIPTKWKSPQKAQTEALDQKVRKSASEVKKNSPQTYEKEEKLT